MDYQLSLNTHQHAIQISSNVQSPNSQILQSVHQQCHNIQTSLPLPPLNSMPIHVAHHLPQLLNGTNLNSQSLNIENTLLHVNNGNSQESSTLLQHHSQNSSQNDSNIISNSGINSNNSNILIDNNNNSNANENSRWSNFQVQQFWKHNIQCKSGNKEVCADEKFKEDGDPWSVEAQAAFLGPILWDKTLPYDADLKVPQYEDLDEFLSENNMPDGLTGGHIANSAGFSHRSDSLGHSAVLSLGLGHVTTKKERSPSPSDCISPDTLNPPSPAESTFSFASSGRDFDPRTRAFSDEELKPQPMIKKSRKQFVPDELKDDKYWARRRKNNIAAKRSRDARRQKENQIAMRARYLEKENATLHQEVEQLKQENMDLRSRLSKYNEV